MLKINNLTVGFNLGTPLEKIILNDFNLEVNDDDFIVLLGSNGSGKSTLFNAILGYLNYSGNIYLDDINLNKLPEYKRSKYIGVVFQDPLKGTSPNLKVIDNMLLSTKKNFVNKRKYRRSMALELKEYNLGLENHLDNQAKTLSGGQRQALTLYMACNSNPKLLLLDEHTAALDPNTSKVVMTLTNNIVENKKMTTLMITHNLQSAIKYGNRLIVLNEGKVVVDIKGDEKKNMTEKKLLELYSKHFSDEMLFSSVK